MKPAVSVIMPVYNSEEFLKQALTTIVMQSLNNIEIIIVDDGSVDSSKEIANDFAKVDERVKIITQKHQGAGAARNKGLSIAEGEYLSFLDSDDLFDLDMLELMYKHSVKYDLDVLITPHRLIIDENNVRRGVFVNTGIEIFNNKKISNKFYQISSPNAWNKMFKRGFVIGNNIWFQDISSCNDVYFTYASMTLANKISILDRSFVIYRKNVSGSITSSRGEKFKNIFSAGEKIRSLLKSEGLYDNLLDSFYNRMRSCFIYESSFVGADDIEEFNMLVDSFLPDGFKF